MHWYVLSQSSGMATLCASEQDARREAAAYDRLYPKAAPHIATELVPAFLVRAAMPCDADGRALHRLRVALGITDDLGNMTANAGNQRGA